MNTIVFEDEIDDMKKQLQLLNEIGVDGVIVQDLAAVFSASNTLSFSFRYHTVQNANLQHSNSLNE